MEYGYQNLKQHMQQVEKYLKAPVKESSVVYTSDKVWSSIIERKGENSEQKEEGYIPARNWLDGVYEANKEKNKISNISRFELCNELYNSK